MTTRYTTTTRTLGWHEPDRLLRYLVQRNAGAGDAQGTQSTLITVTYL